MLRLILLPIFTLAYIVINFTIACVVAPFAYIGLVVWGVKKTQAERVLTQEQQLDALAELHDASTDPVKRKQYLAEYKRIEQLSKD